MTSSLPQVQEQQTEQRKAQEGREGRGSLRGKGARSRGVGAGTYLAAVPEMGMGTSPPTLLHLVLDSRFFLIFQVVAAESGPATEGELQLNKYGVWFLRFAVVHCHMVADGRRALALRLREEMGWQRARERCVGP